MAKRTKMPDYIIYTDGGCAVNPGGPGGIGVVIVNTKTEEVQEVSQGFRSTTNNRMEMMAVIAALRSVPEACSIRLYSDSQYVLNCMSNIWKKKKNTDLWKLVDQAAKGKDVDLRWVRGHHGDKYNERCDALATMAIQDKTAWEVDEGYERKKEGWKDFYEKTEKSIAGSQRGGAMGFRIMLPEDIADPEPDIIDHNAYADEHGIRAGCARSIKEFYAFGNRSFTGYMKLKTMGFDSVSRMKKEALEEKCADGGYASRVIFAHITDEKDALSALRWHVRGLTIRDSIRKVLVDMEVRENCKKS